MWKIDPTIYEVKHMLELYGILTYAYEISTSRYDKEVEITHHNHIKIHY